MPTPREPRGPRPGGGKGKPPPRAGGKGKPPPRSGATGKPAPRAATGKGRSDGARRAGGDRREGGPGDGRSTRPTKPGRPGRPQRAGRQDRPDRTARGDRRSRPDGPAKEREPELETPQSWGGVARRGAGRLRDGGPSKASAAWRAAGEEDPLRPTPQEEWVRVDEVRGEAGAAVRRGRTAEPPSPRTPRAPAPEVAEELTRAAGAGQAPKLGQKLADATRAFERERFTEARSMLRPLAEKAPTSAAVRELYGLTLYRLGQWKSATKELEAFAAITGSTEQHPVLADCARALKRWDRVEELWTELKAASPGPELVAEGRIVVAGALADQGRLDEAIALLEPVVARTPRKTRDHHLRLLYALADLRERAGEVPAARTLFRRIQVVAPDFADVTERLRSLR